jgi:hypothetical protein
MAVPKWKGPWIGKSAVVPPGSQTVRLSPRGKPTVHHYARYNLNPASMWGYDDTWPLVNPPSWYGVGALESAAAEELGDTERWCCLGGPMTILSGRAGEITAIEAGVTWAPTAEAGFGSSHLIRVFAIVLAENDNPWIPASAPWFTGFELRKVNGYGGNEIMCTSDTPKAPGTDITTSYIPGVGLPIIGEDILSLNSLFMNIALGMSASSAGFEATWNFTELYLDVTYTQT